MAGVREADGLGVTAFEVLRTVLAERLQQGVSGAVGGRPDRDHRGVDQRAQQVDDVVPFQAVPTTHGLCRGQVESSSEQGQAVEEALLVGGQQLVGPVEDGPEAGVAAGLVIEGRPDVQAAGHPLHQVGGVEGPDPGGGQLEGQREAVELSADVDDDAEVVPVETQVRTDGAGALSEQGDRWSRRVGSADGGGTGSGATGRTCSPATPSLVRLVARTTRRGQPRSSDSTKGRMPSRRCSQLSRTSSMCRSERKSTTDSTTPVSADRRTPNAVATAALAAEGSVTGASSHQETPSANGPDAAAALMASRVLPTPPTPVRVTSREPARAATASATS